MNILTLNVGSSSLKYSFWADKKLLYNKTFEKVYELEDRLNCITKIKAEIKETPTLVIHRVVHGRDIKDTSLINDELILKLKEAAELAPLHVKPQIEVIKHSLNIFKTTQIAVFDTAFHSTIRDKARIYGLPYKYFEKGIKKYGFHGINHKYVSRNESGRVISLHLGSGCSICAIKDGKSFDTTMGFTPLEGLLMTTRSGSLDPTIIPFMIEHEGVSARKIVEILNKESGLLGISGISKDMKELLESKEDRAKLAVDVFIYKAIKELGSMISVLKGVDTIIFTGGIGENSNVIRKRILENFEYLGLKINPLYNKENKEVISDLNSTVIVKVKKANEELEMVLEGLKIWKSINK
jgi:acetate kinase